MAEKETLKKLAENIQIAVSQHADGNNSSHAEIYRAIEKLRLAIEPPFVSMSRQRFRLVQNICIVMGIEMGLFEQLVKNHGSSLNASDLANATEYDELLIVRTMRVLTALGFADETGYQTYAANSLTALQDSAGGRGGVILTNDMMMPLAGNIRSYLREHKPCDRTKAPPPYDFTMGEAVWQTLRKNPEWKQGFDDSMTIRLKLATVPWFDKFPVRNKLFTSSLDNSHVIVDIGGNQGSDLQRLADRFPTQPFQLVLQDLAETINTITETLDPRIKPTVYDFFTEQPVKGADIYYLKAMIHNWDDESSTKILSNVANAMQSHSRLLINDIVLPDTNASLDKADMDMLMLFLLNGMERTETQWRTLLANVEPPLKILDIWTVEGDSQSVVEAVLAYGESL